jgi:outer membrane protein assembly factor BamE (lipoprotein component of BamABCDE complex)
LIYVSLLPDKRIVRPFPLIEIDWGFVPEYRASLALFFFELWVFLLEFTDELRDLGFVELILLAKFHGLFDNKMESTAILPCLTVDSCKGDYMKTWIYAISVLAGTLFLMACDRQGRPIEEFGLDKLARGVSSESDVRMIMGQPDTVWEDEDGSRTLEYPKGPMGPRTWMFMIDKDGKLKDYKQVLTEENFANIKPGMSKDDVRRMLGRPRTVVQFKLKNEEVWDWRYLQLVTNRRLFNVHFDMNSGKVTQTSSLDDPSAG